MPGIKVGNKNMKNKNTKTKNKVKSKMAGTNASTKSWVSGETVAVTNRSGPRQPKTTMTNGATVVTHTETFGTNVVGSSAFSLTDTWAIQPGISTYSRGEPMGVWLPQIAQNFDHYEIESLRFKFRTACSTLTPGLGIFAYEPNPEAFAPSTYQEMRNMYSIDSSIHSNFVLDVSSRCKGRRLTRRGNVVNLPTYDMGKVYFGTIGVTDGALCGFIDVEYKIRLINPQSANSLVASATVLSVGAVAKQRYTVDASTFGVVNAASDCMGYTSTILAAATSSGCPLTTVVTRSVAVATQTVEGANIFVAPGSGSNRVLQFTRAGRYRITFQPRLDWEDLKMFALGIFRVLSDNTHATGAVQTVYTDLNGATTTALTAPIYAHRGFTGTAVGDPNPGTDMFPVFVWDVDALTDAYQFVLKIGVLSYNSVSTTTANLQGRSGLGLTKIDIDYLGPLITTA